MYDLQRQTCTRCKQVLVSAKFARALQCTSFSSFKYSAAHFSLRLRKFIKCCAFFTFYFFTLDFFFFFKFIQCRYFFFPAQIFKFEKEEGGAHFRTRVSRRPLKFPFYFFFKQILSGMLCMTRSVGLSSVRDALDKHRFSHKKMGNFPFHLIIVILSHSIDIFLLLNLFFSLLINYMYAHK